MAAIRCDKHELMAVHHHGPSGNHVYCRIDDGYDDCPACEVGAQIYYGAIIAAADWWKGLNNASKVAVYSRETGADR